MRHIKISNAVKIEAEISARSYKKLCQYLKGYNRKQLWKIMDHYIFHVMEDRHVEELVKILDQFNATNSLEDTPAPTPVVLAEASEEEFVPERRMKFATPITAEDLDSSASQLDILYDINYFSYLTLSTAQANAKKLIEYAEANNIPPPAHWRFIAASDDFLKPEAGEEIEE